MAYKQVPRAVFHINIMKAFQLISCSETQESEVVVTP